MTSIRHFTEYECGRCKGIERRPHGASPPAGWRWIGHGHDADDLYRKTLLCRHCDERLEAFLSGHPINEGEAAVTVSEALRIFTRNLRLTNPSPEVLAVIEELEREAS